MPTEEKQMTACQELIEELEQLKPLSKLISSDVVKGLNIAIEQVKLKLTTERQQLIDAYGSDRTPCSEQDAIDYFETTFKPQ